MLMGHELEIIDKIEVEIDKLQLINRMVEYRTRQVHSELTTRTAQTIGKLD